MNEIDGLLSDISYEIKRFIRPSIEGRKGIAPHCSTYDNINTSTSVKLNKIFNHHMFNVLNIRLGPMLIKLKVIKV